MSWSLLPSGLPGRLALVIAGGLIGAIGAGAAIHLQDRGEALFMAGGVQTAQRFAALVQVLDPMTPEERQRVAVAIGSLRQWIRFIEEEEMEDFPEEEDDRSAYVRGLLERRLEGRPLKVKVFGEEQDAVGAAVPSPPPSPLPAATVKSPSAPRSVPSFSDAPAAGESPAAADSPAAPPAPPSDAVPESALAVEPSPAAPPTDRREMNYYPPCNGPGCPSWYGRPPYPPGWQIPPQGPGRPWLGGGPPTSSANVKKEGKDLQAKAEHAKSQKWSRVLSTDALVPQGISFVAWVKLEDGVWAEFHQHLPRELFTWSERLWQSLGILLLGVLIITFLAVRLVMRPLEVLSGAVERVGRGGPLPPL
ncbi:MAG: hypothetical protein HQL51_07765, partial [Magnetococcales bacterium]|nr:hypothetical protein [Magnetococcales bacterium]